MRKAGEKRKRRCDDGMSIRENSIPPPPSVPFLSLSSLATSQEPYQNPNYTSIKTEPPLPPYLYRWYRPRATKKMTVEFSRASGPFIWPAEPTDFSAWSKNVYDTSEKEKEAEEKRMSPDAARLEKEDGAVLRTQAERLLRGEERWRGKWVVP